MASPASTTTFPNAQATDESDYGSDFSSGEEEIVNRLLLLNGPERLRDIEDNPVITDLESNVEDQTVRVSRILGRERRQEMVAQDDSLPVKSFDPGYSNLSNAQDAPLQQLEARKETDFVADNPPDNRSPIERFRSAPRKAFSVSDLVSPAWCELQYWYTLRFHGRKIRTEVMKRGSVVHKKLEEQVYTTVKVDMETKEDRFGLRLWNVIQGLRTLQEIGYTRELEVWGTIDGFVVNGIIDEISFSCPDLDLEAELLGKKKSTGGYLPAGQTTIADYLKAYGGTSISDASNSMRLSTSRRIYICDVKTRSHLSLPKGASFRPTKMQLMFYHRLLSNLATNQVDLSVLLNRYDLNGDKPFSDSFIAQIGNLNDGIPFDTTPDSTPESTDPSSQDSVSMLLSHNSLSQLWSLMIDVFQKVLPNGKDSIGNVLRAEYRSRDHGGVLGSSTLAMDDGVLNLYIEHQMKWWRGEREPLGVVKEEAYKCHSCEFAEKCEWRLARIEEAREKARENKMAIRETKKWPV